VITTICSYKKHCHFHIELDNNTVAISDGVERNQISFQNITDIIVIRDFCGCVLTYPKTYIFIYGNNKQLLKILHPNTRFLRELKLKYHGVHVRTFGLCKYVTLNIIFILTGFLIGVL
jgi:hypothetical protein